MKCEIKIKGNKIFATLKNKWLILTPEEKVRQEFINELVNLYGYSIDQIDQDVIEEINKDYTDIVIWKESRDKQDNKKPSIIIVIELKADYLTIDEKKFRNGYQFAVINEAQLFIAKNKKETTVYYIDNKATNRQKKLNQFPTSSILQDKKKFQKYIEESLEFNREDLPTPDCPQKRFTFPPNDFFTSSIPIFSVAEVIKTL